MDYFFVSILSDQDRVCEYNMKLMDIDSEHLGIPVSNVGCGIVHQALQSRMFFNHVSDDFPFQ